MTDLTQYNAIAMQTMQYLVDQLPASQRKEVELLIQQGLCLKLSTLCGEQPDVVLTLVNDLGFEMLLFSLVGKAGETIQ